MVIHYLRLYVKPDYQDTHPLCTGGLLHFMSIDNTIFYIDDRWLRDRCCRYDLLPCRKLCIVGKDYPDLIAHMTPGYIGGRSMHELYLNVGHGMVLDHRFSDILSILCEKSGTFLQFNKRNNHTIRPSLNYTNFKLYDARGYNIFYYTDKIRPTDDHVLIFYKYMESLDRPVMYMGSEWVSQNDNNPFCEILNKVKSMVPGRDVYMYDEVRYDYMFYDPIVPTGCLKYKKITTGDIIVLSPISDLKKLYRPPTENNSDK